MQPNTSTTPSLVPQQVLDRIAAIALRIRQSPDLFSILNTAVIEVRELLQTDRVLIYRFQSDGSGVVIVESVGSEWTPILGKFIHDPCFNARSAESYRKGRVSAIVDIYATNINPCYLELLAQFQVRANLVVPILQGENLWGLLIAHHCSDSRQWQPLEIDLLSTLAVQMAIAIQQAELYQQAQTELAERRRAEAELSKLNQELEARVIERTAQLEQVNEQLQAEIKERLQVQKALQESQLCLRLINTISTARTTGFSEEQIIERTLNQIHQFFSHLGVTYCTVDQQGQSTILHAIEAPGILLAEGSVTDLAVAPAYLNLLHQGEPAIVEDVAQEPMLTPLANWLKASKTQALLAVPLRHSGKLRGLLSLHAAAPQRWSEYQIGSLMEIADYLSLTLQEAYQNQERQRTEKELKASLREKEVLLKEVHHRVKNNLQIVSGLLYLQSRYVQEEKTLQVLQETRTRIQSIALLHEKLYGSQNLDKIDFRDYVSCLTNNLFISCGVNTDIIVPRLNIEPVCLDIDTAIPCGLIVNELVSNSLKHAFPQGRSGEIAIEFYTRGEKSFELIVTDNGVGFTGELNFQNKKSLGLRLVHSLATKQLDGTIEADGSQGAKFKIGINT